MFFRKKEEPQRPNQEAPKAEPSAQPEPSPTQASHPPVADPTKLDAVNRKAKEILDTGRIPDCLFVCWVFQPGGGQKPVMLLFSTTFAATDYLRATGTNGTVRQLKVDALCQCAQSWLASGVELAVLDRCPRCPQFVTIGLAQMAQWTKEDFAKAWSTHRAVRLVMGEVRVRSAMNHLAAGSHAAARSDLQYVRDHFACGVPYLHQMIGLLAGTDEAAKAAAIERLKEFGPQFESSLNSFSPELLAKAMVGLTANFGILATSPHPK